MKKRKTIGWLVFAALLVVIGLSLPRTIGAVFYHAGSSFYSARNYRAAAGAFQGTVLLQPGFARGYIELGSAYLALKNYPKAERAFLKASSIRDESCAACGLGMTYYRQDRYDDAEKAFKRAISLNPNDVCAYDESGRMYYDQGKYQEAIAALKRALELNPHFGTYMYLGNAYVYAREFEPGVSAYKEALRIDPKDSRAHFQLGFAYDSLHRYEEAAAEYEQAIKLDPNQEDAHYSLTLLYLAMHNKPAALAQFEVLRKVSPDRALELLEDSSFPLERERGKEKLYFVPIGDFSTAQLNKLVTHYKQKSNLTAIPTKPLPLALPAIDNRRQQLIAEEVVELIKRKYPELAADPNAVIIGLTDKDIYVRKKTWQFALCYRMQGRFAIVSSARMNPANLGFPANNDLFESRMRKMVLKNIGILYYRLPTNYDPKSVLYSEVQGVEDLDKMSEDL